MFLCRFDHRAGLVNNIGRAAGARIGPISVREISRRSIRAESVPDISVDKKQVVIKGPDCNHRRPATHPRRLGTSTAVMATETANLSDAHRIGGGGTLLDREKLIAENGSLRQLGYRAGYDNGAPLDVSYPAPRRGRVMPESRRMPCSRERGTAGRSASGPYRCEPWRKVSFAPTCTI
jgi:hypothetical protein